ncbi:MAG TPA: FecR domain-containing protein [Thermoanaerobaculia bacterium]|nr:FecR domain-containing protein [Thermoanaerobaculia bacterium]
MPFPWIRCGGRGARRLGLVLLAVPFLGGQAAAASSDRSGFITLVEGAAAVAWAESQEPAAENQELRGGDRLTTASGGRVEAVLADGTVIHLDGDSDLVFAELAGPNEGDPPSNLLLLERGELLLASVGDTETRVDTANATVYLGAGAYRLEYAGDSTRVIVRGGEAELRTRRGAVSVVAGEQAAIDGGGPVVGLARGPDALEQWAAALGELRERWAWCPQCRRGYWSFGEEDGGLDFVFTDFGAGTWDDGAPGCFEHPDGGARRTRPPHPEDDPGRVGVPIARGPGLLPDGAIEAPVTKPWPLEDSSAIDTAPTPVAKPPLDPDDTWQAASVGGAVAEPSPAVDSSPSSSTDSPAATADTSWASNDSASSAPTVEDTSSHDSGFVEAPSARDPGIEPNR